LKGTEYLEKFINSVLNDCSYCLEEGLNSLKSIKKNEIEEDSGK